MDNTCSLSLTYPVLTDSIMYISFSDVSILEFLTTDFFHKIIMRYHLPVLQNTLNFTTGPQSYMYISYGQQTPIQKFKPQLCYVIYCTI